MKIYLSCDNKNEFFVKSVNLAVRRARRKFTGTLIDLIYPPRGIGGDTGKVLTNILRLFEADLTLIDASPRMIRGTRTWTYNPGVMIEYGIVLALDNPTAIFGSSPGVPWQGRQPRPTYRVFCHRSCPRSSLTPIINQESVRDYKRGASGRDQLIREILRLIESKLTEFPTVTTGTFTYNPQGPAVGGLVVDPAGRPDSQDAE